MSTNERTPSGQLHKDIIIPIVKTNIGKRPKLIYQKKENIIIYKISSAIKTKNKNKQVRKHGEHLHPRVTPTTLYSANSICGPLSPQTDSLLWGCRDCASPSLCQCGPVPGTVQATTADTCGILRMTVNTSVRAPGL